ncbi:hypothetical protein [Kineococcus rubinsiae]|uniref:hypothetical protein n=1 Tax=Kineococcus rubinsiae TaxID=2609562 RepID=UPI001431DA3E|nr:hypothetical protein [Kineococcus rubinsiae]NIZ90429.1 hypothetical protein [Kineococcus rubinsiae]
MQSPARGAVRLVRAAAVATVVVALASTAHVAGGGVLPGPLLLSAVLVVTACAAVLLTGRRLSPAALLVALGAGQAGVHAALTAFAVETVPVVGAAHHAEWTPVALQTSPGTASAALPSAIMLATHVVATVLAAGVLACAERGVWTWWAWLQPLHLPVPAALHLLLGEPTRAPAPVAPVLRRPRPVLLRRSPRRGPPGGRAPAPPAPLPRVRALAA